MGKIFTFSDYSFTKSADPLNNLPLAIPLNPHDDLPPGQKIKLHEYHKRKQYKTTSEKPPKSVATTTPKRTQNSTKTTPKPTITKPKSSVKSIDIYKLRQRAMLKNSIVNRNSYFVKLCLRQLFDINNTPTQRKNKVSEI